MRLQASGLFEPEVVYGYFPAQGDGNDVVVYEPRAAELRSRQPGEDAGPHTNYLRFTFPRQKEGRRLSISDFFAPKSSGKMDVIGLSLVTIGPKASIETQRLFEGGEYTKYLYLHGLSVETAEALAEFHHKKMREELGISGDDAPADSRFVPPEVSRIAVFVRLSSVPESGGSDQALCPAQARGECGRAPDFRIPARTGAKHLGDCGAPSGREVLCSMSFRFESSKNSRPIAPAILSSRYSSSLHT